MRDASEPHGAMLVRRMVKYAKRCQWGRAEVCADHAYALLSCIDSRDAYVSAFDAMIPVVADHMSAAWEAQSAIRDMMMRERAGDTDGASAAYYAFRDAADRIEMLS